MLHVDTSAARKDLVGLELKHVTREEDRVGLQLKEVFVSSCSSSFSFLSLLALCSSSFSQDATQEVTQVP